MDTKQSLARLEAALGAFAKRLAALEAKITPFEEPVEEQSFGRSQAFQARARAALGGMY